MKFDMYKFILLISIFFVCFSASNSQLAIQTRNLDISNYPLVSIEVRATLNNSSLELNENNTFIIDGVASNKGLNIEAESGGWQKVEWFPITDFVSSSIIVITEGDFSASESIGTLDIGQDKYAQIIYYMNGKREDSYDFGDVKIGETKYAGFTARFIKTPLNPNGTEKRVWIDSLVVEGSDAFNVEWRGNQRDNSELPSLVFTTFDNGIIITYSPKDNNPHSAIVTLYYHGGSRRSLRLSGNKLRVDAESILKLENPNGNESFAPCEDIEINWTGNNKSLPTVISFSDDSGDTWSLLESVQDSSYIWKVPKVITDEARIKIAQEFEPSPPFNFSILSDISAIKYNPTGTSALSFLSDGRIREWDIQNLGGALMSYNAPSSNIVPIDISYLNNNEFVALYRRGSSHFLAYYRTGTSTPIEFEELIGISPNKIVTSYGENIYTFISPDSPVLNLYSTIDKSLIRKLNFEAPIVDVSFSVTSRRFSVALLNGDVLIFDLDNFSLIKKVELVPQRLLTHCKLAPNGRFIAFSTMPALDFSVTGTLSMVIDIESETILFATERSSSEAIAIDFSPGSNILALAYKFNPQIILVDLVEQTLIEQIQGSIIGLTDLDFSEGSNVILVSFAGDAAPFKLSQFDFSYPERDISDTNFTISYPVFDTKTMEFEEEFIFNNQEKSFSIEFCNIGETKLIIESFEVEPPQSFEVVNFGLPDTILPNNCISMDLIFNPKDTGNIDANLILYSCGESYEIPLNGLGKNRNIDLLVDGFDFGEACVQDTNYFSGAVIINNDPIPVLINNLVIETERDVFFVETGFKDTLLASNSTLNANFKASPNRLGLIEGNLSIRHSNQSKYKQSGKLFITGIGTFVEISHQVLPFIPELRERNISVKNTGDVSLVIDDAIISDENEFEILTNLPIILLPGESAELTIRWLGNGTNVNERLELQATPCLTQKFVSLVDYSGTADIIIQDTDVDARDTAIVIINYNYSENHIYNGSRFFDIVLRIDYQLFYPLSVFSNYGVSKVEDLGIDMGERLIRIEIEGDFDSEGILLELKGLPGLAEIIETPITVDMERSEFFGERIRVNSNGGILRLLGICDDRRFINTNTIEINKIYPNPAQNYINFEIFSDSHIENKEVQIIDDNGNIIFTNLIGLSEGLNYYQLDLSNYKTGSYTLRVLDNKNNTNEKFIILR